MATSAVENLFSDDYEILLNLIEENFEKEFPIFVEDEKPINDGFRCSSCGKIFTTSRGLNRHCSSIHKAAIHINDVTFADMKNLLETACKKVASDDCYPKEMTECLMTHSFTDSEVEDVYDKTKEVIESFQPSNIEEFAPKFCKCFDVDDPIRNIDPIYARVVAFELAVLIISHITASSSSSSNNIMVFKHSSADFTDKERSIIYYLSGYVLGTFYRRLRFQKKSYGGDENHKKQCLMFLSAGKSEESIASLPEQRLVSARNRGGLWYVQFDVFEIFCTVESKFREFTKQCSTSIDSKKIVLLVTGDSRCVEYLSKWKALLENEIENEIVSNLLEDLIHLYVKVRTFSMVKSKQQELLIASKSKKSKMSLRTELKKGSDTLP